MLLILSFYLGLGGDYIILKGDDVGRGEGYGYSIDAGVSPVTNIVSGIGFRSFQADYRDTTFSLNGFYIFYKYGFAPLKTLSIFARLEGGLYDWKLLHNGEQVRIINFVPPSQIDTIEVKGRAPGVGGGIGLEYHIKRVSIGFSGSVIYLTNGDREDFGKEDDNEWFYQGRVNCGIRF